MSLIIFYHSVWLGFELFGLWVQVHLFQAMQFSETVQFSISMLLVLFNPQIRPFQVLPFGARVNLGAMAMKGRSAFHKALAFLEPHHQIFSIISRTLVEGVLPICREAVGIFCSTSWLSNIEPWWLGIHTYIYIYLYNLPKRFWLCDPPPPDNANCK